MAPRTRRSESWPAQTELLHDAMQEAEREKLTYGLRHIAFNPNEPMTDDQLAEFAERICHEFHADPEHITLVIHKKKWQHPRTSAFARVATGSYFRQ